MIVFNWNESVSARPLATSLLVNISENSLFSTKQLLLHNERSVHCIFKPDGKMFNSVDETTWTFTLLSSSNATSYNTKDKVNRM